MIEQFHFLRPLWFLALLPLLALLLWFWRRTQQRREFSHFIDPALQKHVLSQGSAARSNWSLWLLATVAILSVLALAGPVWQKLPQAVFQQQSALVILLDLSRSMDATDIKPSRLERAKLKLRDLLQTRKSGQTALIAYAADAFTVSPLTDDSDTIEALLAALGTDIMPAQGSRADLAVQQAQQLFAGAGVTHGDILLISDGLSQQEIKGLGEQLKDSFSLSILAVGSAEGAPIPLANGGFVKDAQGSIVISKTAVRALQQASTDFGGVFSSLRGDDRDIAALQAFFNRHLELNQQQVSDLKADQWREQGPWLVLIMLPLVLWLFRKNALPGLLLVMLVMQLPHPAEADDALSIWDRWFKNPQQQGQQLLQQGDPESAAQKFTDPQWQASALYQSGEYEQALKQWQELPQQSPQMKYNEANTLAQLGRLKEALQAYDEVLSQQPENEDAQYNRKLVEEALKRQQQQQQDQQSEQSDQATSKPEQNSQSGAQQQSDSAQQQDSAQSQPSQADQQSQQQSDAQQGSASQQPGAQQNQTGAGKSASEATKPEDETDGEASAAAHEAGESEPQSNNNAAAQAPMPQTDPAEEALQSIKANEQMQDDAAANLAARPPATEQQAQANMQQQAEAQWLRKIPDDPAGLLRNKFLYQYQRLPQQNTEQQPW